MRGIFSRAAVLFFCVLVAGGSRAHALEMRDGEWEVVSETSVTMGAISMPGMTSKATLCLTRDDPYPTAEKEKDCKVVDQKVVGNKVSWRIVCKDAEGDGEITYSGTSYKGTFRMRTTDGGEATRKRTEKSAAKAKQKKAAEEEGVGEETTMTMKLSGKYLGPCPKGQKSGFTGETAARQAQAEQGIAAAKQAQAEQEALRKKCEEFMKRVSVPAEDPGGCVQNGFGWSAKCHTAVGDLNLQYGLYEITVEEANRAGQFCSMKEEKRKNGEKPITICMNQADPVPPELRTGRQVRQVRRGKDRITWKDSFEGGEVRGGVVYRGTSFEGVLYQKTGSPSGMESIHVKRVTGRRVGEGDCRDFKAGYEYTSRERSDAAVGGSKGKQPSQAESSGAQEGPKSPDAAPTEKEKPSDSGKGSGEINPVKEIRKLFKF